MQLNWNSSWDSGSRMLGTHLFAISIKLLNLMHVYIITSNLSRVGKMTFREFLLEVSLSDLPNMSLEQLKSALAAVRVRLTAPRITPEKITELRQLEEYIYRAIKSKERNPDGPAVVSTQVGRTPVDPEPVTNAKPTPNDVLHTWGLYYYDHPDEIEEAITELKELDRKKKFDTRRLYEIIKYLRNIQKQAGISRRHGRA